MKNQKKPKASWNFNTNRLENIDLFRIYQEADKEFQDPVFAFVKVEDLEFVLVSFDDFKNMCNARLLDNCLDFQEDPIIYRDPYEQLVLNYHPLSDPTHNDNLKYSIVAIILNQIDSLNLKKHYTDILQKKIEINKKEKFKIKVKVAVL